MSLMRLAPCVAAVALSSMPACSTPQTDIAATSTERIGEYQVTEARRADGQLSLEVCTAAGANIDRIAARIVQQLLNQGYADVTLELGPPPSGSQAEVTRVTWSRDKGRRVVSGVSANLQRCRDRVPHGASS
jgi:hypothetical protein